MSYADNDTGVTGIYICTAGYDENDIYNLRMPSASPNNWRVLTSGTAPVFIQPNTPGTVESGELYSYQGCLYRFNFSQGVNGVYNDFGYLLAHTSNWVRLAGVVVEQSLASNSTTSVPSVAAVKAALAAAVPVAPAQKLPVVKRFATTLSGGSDGQALYAVQQTVPGVRPDNVVAVYVQELPGADGKSFVRVLVPDADYTSDSGTANNGNQGRIIINSNAALVYGDRLTVSYVVLQ